MQSREKPYLRRPLEEQLLYRGPIAKRQREEVEKMAHWAPHYSITEEKSFGPLDKVSGNAIQGRIISFIKRHAERMASVLDMSLEEYVASMPEIPDHVDSENPAFHPFLVDPRLNSGAFDVRTTSFRTEQEIDWVFKANRQDKPRIEWGVYVPTELVEKDRDQKGLRHANVQDLLFAYEQYMRPNGFDYLFAHGSVNEEGTARLDSTGAFVFGAYEDGIVGKHNKRFNLVLKK